jgi:crotonobetainyl-CoA:carnitine CoA-transferase CaiB-like acyl-CoA transferase
MADSRQPTADSRPTGPVRPSASRSFKPLAGIRVVDLTRLIPGPLATLLLSDLGAEVVKVEEPSGDPLRHIPPLLGDASALFHCLNRGKRLVSLDLRDAAGRDTLAALIATADCLVEGFRPGVLPRLGLDPADLVRRHPRLVVARISGFGQHGPWRDRPGHDLQYLGLTGVLDRAPTPWPLPAQFADVGAALLAVSSLLAALVGRDRADPADPDARVLDVPVIDAALLFAAPPHARRAAGDDPSPGVGLLEGGFPLYRMYDDSEGRRVALAGLEPRTRDAIVAAFGAVDEASIEARVRGAPRSALETGGLPPEAVEPVLSLDEARLHPAVAARAAFRTMTFGDRDVELPVTPFAAEDDIPQGPWAGPVGRDNDSVLDSLSIVRS